MSAAALDVGIEDGLRYAAENAADRGRLGRIVRSHGASDVAALVDGDMVPPDGIDDIVAYWSGFAHGVGRFLQRHLGLD